MNNIRLLLIASLAVNLFLAGWWVGDRLRQPPRMDLPMPQMMSYADRANPEERAMIGGTFEKVDALIKAGFDQRSATFNKLRELVTHDPFDQATFDQLITQLPQQRLEREEEQWALVRDAIIALSAENRQALAEVFFLPPGPPPGNNRPPPPSGQ
ncbi:MAG: periplasmic heavy metal sensor [Hyphomicrobiales bacterium]|nr:MAG: periplasmic heavy metal sensor [Hyphomicrobiales bacterium]